MSKAVYELNAPFSSALQLMIGMILVLVFTKSRKEKPYFIVIVKVGHVNCKSGESVLICLGSRFKFLFSNILQKCVKTMENLTVH